MRPQVLYYLPLIVLASGFPVLGLRLPAGSLHKRNCVDECFAQLCLYRPDPDDVKLCARQCADLCQNDPKLNIVFCTRGCTYYAMTGIFHSDSYPDGKLKININSTCVGNLIGSEVQITPVLLYKISSSKFQRLEATPIHSNLSW
ncbi:uncharacterized protein BDR25DRAFT_352051 [Lindgomyces ingoldianus]|uniref:Uncharacterized protein n=1 Tax=Lindgomyces ingoldianus TaxID=673940 RepID=A0ACB6R530_9PLEO|nr:uncharacterized protein BDR25DRAFT_352051 [Lindgomyces ingoldianus]KAF2473556.1 hypothetical protein BDR25DRAFT_352051 [Lindgomyces ingoldianus]